MRRPRILTRRAGWPASAPFGGCFIRRVQFDKSVELSEVLRLVLLAFFQPFTSRRPDDPRIAAVVRARLCWSVPLREFLEGFTAGMWMLGAMLVLTALADKLL